MGQNVFTETHLKTTRDYRVFASDLGDVMAKIAKLNYGLYTIEKKDKHFFIMLENMLWFQEVTNKGIRVLGGFNSLKLEIYDYKKEQDEIAEAYKSIEV